MSIALETVLRNRRWKRRAVPFEHVHATDVLKPEAYAAMDQAFRDILARGLSETGELGRLSRRMNNYTAYNLSIGTDETSALALFTSRAWHDMVGRIFGVDLTGELDVSLHHHPAGSRSGWLHTDYSPGWFIDNVNPEGIHLSLQGHGLYKTGSSPHPGQRPRRRMRGVAMLFYLCNPDWTAADGGETGLYSGASQAADRPDARIPPVDNSLVLFECTPFSYHTFMGNPARPRNAVVWWAHRPFEAAVEVWGQEKVSWWK